MIDITFATKLKLSWIKQILVSNSKLTNIFSSVTGLTVNYSTKTKVY